MHHLHQLTSFLTARGLTGVGVVVGSTWRTAELVSLQQWRGKRLHLVAALPGHGLPTVDRPAPGWTDAPGPATELVRHPPACNEAFYDNSLDFICFCVGTNTRYRPRLQQLRAWYPKLRSRGVLVGHAYLDGIWDDSVYGTKTAVDELAAEHGLQVRVTFDTPPAWFVVKRPPPLDLPRRDMALLTAHDANQEDFARYTTPNKEAYCRRYGYHFVQRTDGFAPSRPAAWSKIRFIKQCLREHEWVFWSDADSLVMNDSVRLEEFIDEDYDLVLTHEDMGVGVNNVCTGQMLFRRSKWSMRFLDEVWSQKEFIHDRLWENRAVIHLLWSRDLSDHVQIVTQRRFNSYPSNYRTGDFVFHAAGLPHDQRLSALQTFHQFTEPALGGHGRPRLET